MGSKAYLARALLSLLLGWKEVVQNWADLNEFFITELYWRVKDDFEKNVQCVRIVGKCVMAFESYFCGSDSIVVFL